MWLAQPFRVPCGEEPALSEVEGVGILTSENRRHAGRSPICIRRRTGKVPFSPAFPGPVLLLTSLGSWR